MSCAVCVAAALLPAASLEAQAVQGMVSVGGGVATDQRGIRSNAGTIAPSVLFLPDNRLSLGLGASLTQFASQERAYGGNATLGTRLPMGGVLAFAATAAGAATTTSFDATYASAELTPTLEATLANVTLFGGARLARGSTSLRETTTIPGGPFGAPSAGARTVQLSRTSAGPLFGALVNIAGARPDQGGALSYREERARVDRVAVTDRVASATLLTGPLALTASGGMRDAIDEHASYGSVSATVGLGGLVALQGAVGSYPTNRVTGTFGGRFASLGVVLRGVRRLNELQQGPPKVVGAPPVPAGATRLVLRDAGARRVELAGDWNGWSPTPATRAADGAWYADVRLAPGEYRYAFRVDGGRWAVPERVATVDDGFGGRSALLSVR